MIPLRRSQFQAILLGVVIADAWEQQCLPVSPKLHLPPAKSALGIEGPVGAIGGRWPLRTTTQLQAWIGRPPQRDTGAAAIDWNDLKAAAPQGEALSVLFWLSEFLMLLSESERSLVTGQSDEFRGSKPWVWSFYQGALRLLKAGALPAHSFSVEPMRAILGQAPALGIESGMRRIFEQVLMAQGDFYLALQQNWPTKALPGAPVLGGLLSACWLGYRGIPHQWHQRLISPTPELRDWLQARWQIYDYQMIDTFAEALWQRWRGAYRLPTGTSSDSWPPAVGGSFSKPDGPV